MHIKKNIVTLFCFLSLILFSSFSLSQNSTSLKKGHVLLHNNCSKTVYYMGGYLPGTFSIDSKTRLKVLLYWKTKKKLIQKTPIVFSTHPPLNQHCFQLPYSKMKILRNYYIKCRNNKISLHGWNVSRCGTP